MTCRFRRAAAVFSLAGFLLAACGGGGSSSGSAASSPDTGSTGGTDSSVPQSPPPLMTAAYSGATDEAVIDERDATVLGAESVVMLKAVAGLSSGVATALPAGVEAQVVDDTQAGPDGGKRVTQGRISADRTGWLSSDF